MPDWLIATVLRPLVWLLFYGLIAYPLGRFILRKLPEGRIKSFLSISWGPGAHPRQQHRARGASSWGRRLERLGQRAGRLWARGHQHANDTLRRLGV